MHESDLQKIEILKAENPEIGQLFHLMEEEHHLLLSNISHELRNSLALAISSLQYIESIHPEAKAFPYWIETMGDLIHMKNLLIEFSNYNNGSKLCCQPVDVCPLLEEIHRSMLPFFKEQNQTFLFEKTGPDRTLVLDSTKFKQAVINLLKNASEAVSEAASEAVSEAISEGGSIFLTYQCEPDALSITVRDQGIGMTEEQLATLFKPFTTSKSSGSGLGLPITKRIIEAHGGKLQVNSSPGEGTTCTIIFPTGASAYDT